MVKKTRLLFQAAEGKRPCGAERKSYLFVRLLFLTEVSCSIYLSETLPPIHHNEPAGFLFYSFRLIASTLYKPALQRV